MGILWVTLATANYYTQALPYLGSVAQHTTGIDACALGCVGFQPPADLPTPWRGFHVPDLWLDRRLGNPGNGCVQHGNFLPYLPATSDDTLVVTDGDITMQRDLTTEERCWLADWPEGQIGIGPNAGPHDTLADEAARLYPRCSIADLARRFWPGRDAPLCGNAGVIIARRLTWLDLWARYLAYYEETRPLFGSIAVQQWTINLAVEAIGRVPLPCTFHAHQHYGVPPGCEDRDGAAYCEGARVLLAHHWWASLQQHKGADHGHSTPRMAG